MTKIAVYYPVGGAMRINGTLYFILKDHLGSSSVVTDASGTVVGEDRFYPYGETRFTTGSMNTDKLFTGQREMRRPELVEGTGLGIYLYGARFYSPKLGRFLSFMAEEVMNNLEEIEQFVEAQRQVLSEKEFLDFLFRMLEENPSKEIDGLLRHWLCAYASVDYNRVANYLSQFLSAPDPMERVLAVYQLFTFRLEPEGDAYKILREFLGEEPTKENKDRILPQRIQQWRQGKL